MVHSTSLKRGKSFISIFKEMPAGCIACVQTVLCADLCPDLCDQIGQIFAYSKLYFFGIKKLQKLVSQIFRRLISTEINIHSYFAKAGLATSWAIFHKLIWSPWPQQNE
jgi:hypothetical protein